VKSGALDLRTRFESRTDKGYRCSILRYCSQYLHTNDEKLLKTGGNFSHIYALKQTMITWAISALYRLISASEYRGFIMEVMAR
jgi:hypothetical protein